MEYLFHIGGEGSVLKSEIQCQDMNIVNFRYQQILGEKMETNDNDFNIESIETKWKKKNFMKHFTTNIVWQ